jgi:hypothetical protein
VDAYDLLVEVIGAFKRTRALDLKLELVRPDDYARVARFERDQLVVWLIDEDGERTILAIAYLDDLSREQLAEAAEQLLDELGEQ